VIARPIRIRFSIGSILRGRGYPRITRKEGSPAGTCAIPGRTARGRCDDGPADPQVGFLDSLRAKPVLDRRRRVGVQVAHHNLGLVNPRLYALLARHAPGLVDVTSGNNTVGFAQGNPPQNFTVQGYSAGKGYDLATGVGTLDAALFVPELAAMR
jgi:hypothetical protein